MNKMHATNGERLSAAAIGVRVASSLVVGLLLTGAPSSAADATPAAGSGPAASTNAARPDFQLPFPCGQKWRLDTYASDHAPALDMVREPDQEGTEGSPVVAPADGVVKQSFTHDKAGNLIQISHGGDWFTTYIHLQSRSVQVGQHVGQGQEIGRVGKTGETSGGHPHLHFEQAVDKNKDGTATWGEPGSERVGSVFNGVEYSGTGKTWRNVTSNNSCER